jgi:hypothetical protein
MEQMSNVLAEADNEVDKVVMKQRLAVEKRELELDPWEATIRFAGAVTQKIAVEAVGNRDAICFYNLSVSFHVVTTESLDL